MKKIVYLTPLTSALIGLFLIAGCSPSKQGEADVKDLRGKMEPWETGAWETGKYRNVFFGSRIFTG